MVMKIAVCAKQIPDPANPSIANTSPGKIIPSAELMTFGEAV